MSTPVEHHIHGLALPALRIVRERSGLSQEELAAKAGITRTAVANLERGASRSRPSTAYRLAEALGVHRDVLTGALPPPSDEPQQLHGILSDYCDAAMHQAIYRRVRGGQDRIYAAIPGMPGLWARGFTREEAERDLREALEWWVLTAVFEHRPLPTYDGVSLEIVEESKGVEMVIYPAAAATGESFLDDMEGELEIAE